MSVRNLEARVAWIGVSQAALNLLRRVTEVTENSGKRDGKSLPAARLGARWHPAVGGSVAHADSLESGSFTRARAFPQIPLDLRPPSCHIGMRLAVQEVPYRLIERPRPAGSRAGLCF